MTHILQNVDPILEEIKEIDKSIISLGSIFGRQEILQQKILNNPDSSQQRIINGELESLDTNASTLFQTLASRIKDINNWDNFDKARHNTQLCYLDCKR